MSELESHMSLSLFSQFGEPVGQLPKCLSIHQFNHSKKSSIGSSSPKAFDKVPHRRLLVKLEALGIWSPLLDFIGSYLSNRSQKVLVEGNRNLVYSAPTSAGKTLVAEIIILKRILSTNKKALFILPYVSVSREKVAYIQKLFSGVGLRVGGFMGGLSPVGGLATVHLAVCTIEKANSLINRLIEEDRLSDLGLIVVDELHLISDPHRGYLLELLLTKILLHTRMRHRHASEIESIRSPSSASQDKNRDITTIQIVGMSATLSNLPLLAEWLQAAMYTTEFRPTPLTELVFVRDSTKSIDQVYRIRTEESPVASNQRKEFLEPISFSESGLFSSPAAAAIRSIDSENDGILSLCLDTLISGYAALVFRLAGPFLTQKGQTSDCTRPTARLTSDPGFILATHLDETGLTECLDRLRHCPTGLDSALACCIRFGCAFHHAGLTIEEREIVETAFRKGYLRLLVATSTLSSGVNLPARRVIIRTLLFHGQTLDYLTYKQMSGRAGRKGIDTEALQKLLHLQSNSLEIPQSRQNKISILPHPSNFGELYFAPTSLRDIDFIVDFKFGDQSHTVNLKALWFRFFGNLHSLMYPLRSPCRIMRKLHVSANPHVGVGCESILLCKSRDLGRAKQLLATGMPPVTSCLLSRTGAPESSLRRALLEVIVNGIVERVSDVRAYMESTLLAVCLKAAGYDYSESFEKPLSPASQLTKLFPVPAAVHSTRRRSSRRVHRRSSQASAQDMAAPDQAHSNLLFACLSSLIDSELITAEVVACEHESCSRPSTPVVGHPIFFSDCTLLRSTALGRAVLSSALGPIDGLTVFAELDRARRNIALDTDLHLVYLVTPIYLDVGESLDWFRYLEIYQNLSASDRRVAELVGVGERFIMRCVAGGSCRVGAKKQSAAQAFSALVHRRFYSALALYRLICEDGLACVSERFRVNRGVLQSLTQQAATYAGMVTIFCNRLGWTHLEQLLAAFQARLLFGVASELIDLMRLSPLISAQRARALYSAGFTSAASLARARPKDVARVLQQSTPFVSARAVNEGDSVGNTKDILLPDGSVITEDKLSPILIAKAAELVREDLCANYGIELAERGLLSSPTPLKALPSSPHATGTLLQRKHSHQGSPSVLQSKRRRRQSSGTSHLQSFLPHKTVAGTVEAVSLSSPAETVGVAATPNDNLLKDVNQPDQLPSHDCDNDPFKLESDRPQPKTEEPYVTDPPVIAFEFSEPCTHPAALAVDLPDASLAGTNFHATISKLADPPGGESSLILSSQPSPLLAQAVLKFDSLTSEHPLGVKSNLDSKPPPVSRLISSLQNVHRLSGDPLTFPVSEEIVPDELLRDDSATRLPISLPKSPKAFSVVQASASVLSSEDAIEDEVANSCTPFSHLSSEDIFSSPSSLYIESSQRISGSSALSLSHQRRSTQTYAACPLTADSEDSTPLRKPKQLPATQPDVTVYSAERTTQEPTLSIVNVGSDQKLWETFLVEASEALGSVKQDSWMSLQPAWHLAGSCGSSGSRGFIWHGGPAGRWLTGGGCSGNSCLRLLGVSVTSPYLHPRVVFWIPLYGILGPSDAGMRFIHHLKVAVSNTQRPSPVCLVDGLRRLLTGLDDKGEVLFQAPRLLVWDAKWWSRIASEVLGIHCPNLFDPNLCGWLMDPDRGRPSLREVILEPPDPGGLRSNLLSLFVSLGYSVDPVTQLGNWSKLAACSCDFQCSPSTGGDDHCHPSLLFTATQQPPSFSLLPCVPNSAVQAFLIATWWTDRCKSLPPLYPLISTETEIAVMLAKSESFGFVLHLDILLDCQSKLQMALVQLERLAHRLVGCEFQLDSPREVANALYTRLRLPVFSSLTAELAASRRARRDRLGFGIRNSRPRLLPTTNAALYQLAPLHPLPRIVIEWRRINGLLTKSFDSLVASCLHSLIDFCVASDVQQPKLSPSKLRITPTYDVFTTTGRIVSSHPNLQSVPKTFTISWRKLLMRPPPITECTTDTAVDWPPAIASALSATAQQEDLLLNPRSAFTAAEGNLLVSADFSHLELRILAHLSGDEDLLRLLNARGNSPNNVDAFKCLAAHWLKRPDAESITEEERQNAKQLCYAIIYGMGARGLATQRDIEVSVAQSIIDDFMRAFPGVSNFIRKTVQSAHKTNRISTVAGRSRFLAGLTGSTSKNSCDEALLEADGVGPTSCPPPRPLADTGIVKPAVACAIAKAERQAVNSVVQGSAADVVKAGMLEVDKTVQRLLSSSEEPRLSLCNMVLHLHDELIYEVGPAAAAPRFSSMLRHCLSSAGSKFNMTVPLPVKIKAGPRWSELQPVDW
ncbi:unnamed protein product [Schistocephalus solidus]|uniref:DNA-directed DNA polymerase n=1 Tax=Schistocephalus solidus TaxID=70667 RepID=A0A183SRF7_SCHSO|nr:unnamed protein product [Schistocephalus solidus]